MRTAFPVQELPVRSALTVAANCVNRTRKHAASVTAYSVLRACPSIQCSTRSLHQQTTGNVESEKGLRERLTKEVFCAHSFPYLLIYRITEVRFVPHPFFGES